MSIKKIEDSYHLSNILFRKIHLSIFLISLITLKLHQLGKIHHPLLAFFAASEVFM